ncbi:hypothetical protein [Pseudomonas sp. CC120222-01a]|uniref:hypothetical protein n=1 Tax=Pseudomonas sp. CC120222-01a TaxID=1378075 RepID=UPI000D8FD071|nr:hypothetical protein [Pseudomonas sp. CC120222-01a]PVZ42296.1 hypothetical protein N430_01532 [Pseudomonas sp. CC120222-01a]
MKFPIPKCLLAGLFALAAVGSASATPMHATHAGLAAESIVQAPAKPAQSPWPNLASVADGQPGPLLAHDDRYWRDGRWHYHSEDRRREEWRRAQWRREQARREAERRHEWERRNERAHHYDDDHRYYRR